MILWLTLKMPTKMCSRLVTFSDLLLNIFMFVCADALIFQSCQDVFLSFWIEQQRIRCLAQDKKIPKLVTL